MKTDDYTDPICPFDTSRYEKDPVNLIPVDRILEKEDEFLFKNDYDGAERLLKYWLSEAEASGDFKGAFFVHNELMGNYRKTGKEKEAMEHAEAALSLTGLLGENSVSSATGYVNAATVRKAFGYAADALPLFEKARVIYEKELKKGDGRLGGLYNNMALALSDLGRFKEAVSYYEKAIEKMGDCKNGELEQAISYLNLCDVYDQGEGNEEKIEAYLARAEELLRTPYVPHDGYYAFVLEKCAPSFDYYGWFMTAAEFKDTAEKIYRGEA